MQNKVNWQYCVWEPTEESGSVSEEQAKELAQHISVFANEKEIGIDSLGWYCGQLRILFALTPDMPLEKAILILQGESQYWMNKQESVGGKFRWVDNCPAVAPEMGKQEHYRQLIQHPEVFQDDGLDSSLNDDWQVFYHESFFG